MIGSKKFVEKEAELLQATAKIKQTSAVVKKLSDEVNSGLATKPELVAAIKKLDKQAERVKILNAESKVLGNWIYGDLTTSPPPKEQSKKLTFFNVIAIAALIYLILPYFLPK
jgi:hypothetical protein